jgi:cyanophycinase
MKKISILLISLFSFYVQTQAQGKLFIIGGGKRPPELLQRLIKEANVEKTGYIVIIPMASEEQDSAIYYAKKQFVKMGIDRVTGFMMEKGQELPQTVIDSIANASLIYISGGDQVRLMSIIGGTPVEKALREVYKKGNVIAGTSAGAAVMSLKMITGVEKKNKNTTEETESRGFEEIIKDNIEIGQGLGFIQNGIIDQHFIKRKRQNRLFAVAIENPNYVCVGIDEATAILVKNGKAEVVGDSQVMVVSTNGKTRRDFNEKIGAKNMRLDLYLNGDVFDLK